MKKSTHRGFRGPNNFCWRALYFLQEIERCADASIDRAAFFLASNISLAFTLHLYKEIDASRFFGARKMFCWREKYSTLEKSSSKTFNVEKISVKKFNVENFQRRKYSALKKYRRKFQRWKIQRWKFQRWKNIAEIFNVEKSHRWKKYRRTFQRWKNNRWSKATLQKFIVDSMKQFNVERRSPETVFRFGSDMTFFVLAPVGIASVWC